MEKNNKDQAYFKGIRFSLCLKLVITAWSFYIAITSETLSVRVLYLVVSIVFAGFFVFQLDFYKKERRGGEM